MRQLRAEIRESWSSAMAMPLTSAMVAIVIGCMCAAVILTSGRAVGAQESVSRTLDSPSSRSVVFRAGPDAALDTDVLKRVAAIDGITRSDAFSAVVDAENAHFSGGERVSARVHWTLDEDWLTEPPEVPNHRIGYASVHAGELLGLSASAGEARLVASGDQITVAGTVVLPDHLQSLQPILILRGDPTAAEAVSLLVIVADSPALVPAVRDAVVGVLGVADPTKVTVETSEKFIQLRTLVDSQLSSFSRSLTFGILALTTALAAAIIGFAVSQRRRDFGRRRALGASQGLIIRLLAFQSMILGAVGGSLGMFGSLFALNVYGDPWPRLPFLLAILLLSQVVSLLASVGPALSAARREPISELRVP